VFARWAFLPTALSETGKRGRQEYPPRFVNA